MTRLILDLCGGTGAWSEPYRQAGYDVRLVTLPGQDVRLYEPPSRVHGILAAPPCTYFCRIRMCRGRPTDEQFIEGLSVVDACLRIVWRAQPKWWALENPQGYLRSWLGDPLFKFDPHDFGDAWTKRTWLWGEFCHPLPLFAPTARNPVDPVAPWLNASVAGRGLSGQTATMTAKTAPGFARAFFEANP